MAVYRKSEVMNIRTTMTVQKKVEEMQIDCWLYTRVNKWTKHFRFSHPFHIYLFMWLPPLVFLTFKMSRDKLYVCACVRVWPRGCRRRWFWAGCDWTVCPRPPTLRWVCVETRSCGCSWGSDSSEIYDCSPIWESQSDRPPRSPPPRTPPASELTHRALTSLQSPSHRVC